MKILLTGGAGYLGSVLVSLLVADGHEVRVLDNLLYGGQSLISMVGKKGFEFVKGDVRDIGVLKQSIKGVDGIVHLAAIVGDPACARNPEEAIDINQRASFRLVKEAREARVQKMIFASTCSNYGKMQDISIFANEDHELRPVSLYAETKVAVEKMLLEIDPVSFPFTIVRFATLYGISPRMRFDLTINEFAKELLLHHKLVVYGEQFWRPYVHVWDAARAICMVLNASNHLTGGQIINVGDTDNNFRKLDLVDILREEIGPVDVEFVHKEDDPRLSCKFRKNKTAFRI